MSALRSPTVTVLADGVAVPGVIEAEVTSVGHYAADCFDVRLALSAAGGLGSWADRTDTSVEVTFGLDGAEASLITGRIDCVSADPIRQTVRLQGRDLSTRLIEARLAESFANQTASEIATLLAARHGLAAQADTTASPVGRYYSSDHTRVTLDRLSRASTEWDLLVLLAEQEGYDLFVSGNTLHFQAPAVGAPAAILQTAVDGSSPSNLSALRLRRRMTLSGDVTVTVRTWNSQQHMAYMQSATRAGDGSTPVTYTYVRPNLTPDEALLLAQRKLETLTRHELVMEAAMPGELDLMPRDTVQLLGTNSVFDQRYVVDEIARRISVKDGFVQHLRAHVPPTITVTGDDTDTF